MTKKVTVPLRDRAAVSEEYAAGYRQALEDIFEVTRCAYANETNRNSGQWTTSGANSAPAFHSLQKFLESELGIKRLDWYTAYRETPKVSPLLSQFVDNLEAWNLT